MDAVRLRPLSFGEALDASFKLFTQNFRRVVPIAAVVVIPLAVIGAVSFVSLDFAALAELDPEAGLEEVLAAMGPFFTGVGTASVLSLLGTAIVQAAVIRVYAAGFQGEEVDWKASLAYGLRRLLPVLVASIAVGLVSTLGLLLCLVPGVWLWTSWYVTIPALVAERLGPFRAMSRSFELVRRHFWPTLGIGVLSFLIVYVAQQVVATSVQIAGLPFLIGQMAEDPQAFPSGFGSVTGISFAATALMELVTLPFLGAVATVVYFDLRVRKEGYDLEMMAAELELRSGAAPASPPGPPDLDAGDPFGLDRPPDS